MKTPASGAPNSLMPNWKAEKASNDEKITMPAIPVHACAVIGRRAPIIHSTAAAGKSNATPAAAINPSRAAVDRRCKPGVRQRIE